MGQHGEAGALLLTGVRAAALFLVHHQQVVEVHFGVYRLCSQQDEESRAEGEKEGRKKLSYTMSHTSLCE